MSNKRITDLTELTNPTTDDVFPVVDIATNTTTKVQLGNLPVPSSVTTALATKQDSLVSGTNIKTINSTSVLGSGDIAVQPTLVSGTSIKTVNSNSLLGSGDVAVQPTLVSGTNIKTINSTSLLGSGDITISANPSGVSGAIQFSNGSAFASDAANLFWDDTNKRLGIGTNAPSATAHFKGSGSTSATTSLLVQNSAGTAALTVRDDGIVLIPRIDSFGYSSSFRRVALNNSTSTVFSYISSTSVGNILLLNSAESDFNRLQFGGTTSSFPAIKRASNNIEIRNADDTFGAGLSVGAALNASAILQADSTTKGFLPPRMTNAQRSAISSPAVGLMVYCTDAVEGLYINKSTGWTLVI
jgi:hypothetical protein